MMRQFMQIKASNPDCLLFYRMGDFYELFFDDAVQAARALGITLTKRGKHLDEDIPMCGVPVHAADDYLHKLIRQGFRIAVCEQMEDPAEARKRGSKSVVRRDVVRLVTPGTITEDNILDSRRNNYLAALASTGGREAARFALAWIDISTGDFRVSDIPASQLAGELSRVEPSELLLADSLFADAAIVAAASDIGAAVTPLADRAFDSVAGERQIRRFFGVGTLDGFGEFTRAEIAAAAAILAYVDSTQRGASLPVQPPRREAPGGFMVIDAATRANLELIRSLSGERGGGLLAAIDRTVTGAGGRELATRLSSPLTDIAVIAERLDAVDWFRDRIALLDSLRAELRAMPDLERAVSRLAVDRGGPRDLAAISGCIAVAATLQGLMSRGEGLIGEPSAIVAACEALGNAPSSLGNDIDSALVEEPPLLARDGGFIASGYHAELDRQRALRDESRQVIAGFQVRYQEETGLKALRIKHNNMLGYFIELPSQQGEGLLSGEHAGRFIHRQTMANAMRFTTTELAECVAQIAAAADRALAIEQEIFRELRAKALADAASLQRLSAAIAALDCSAALAQLSRERGHVRPVVDLSLDFEIEAGRHPVVEEALARRGEPFVANDCRLSPPGEEDAGTIVLLTGPNMAGKSTWLRQNALIAILAQMGAHVPARSARIGVIDRLFSRVGAADDLARGRSTFMVEMIETAAILNQAGRRALVILDEIGRGTATFDGLSIAWATIEHLHEVNCSRAMFATHYHELTALTQNHPRLLCQTVRVSEHEGNVVFLHEVVSGAADRSYGIQVARLAGLPEAVVSRAAEILHGLEEGDRAPGIERLVGDLPLFSQAPAHRPASVPQKDLLAEALAAINPDMLSPRDALDALYRLKEQAAGKEGQ
ncbi:MAG: DNA mismatch repair protein MutS [Rhodobiaceae bacterium]|nr:DNA mismatch repair protein MutS [Rhodobiaceae bacterium]